MTQAMAAAEVTPTAGVAVTAVRKIGRKVSCCHCCCSFIASSSSKMAHPQRKFSPYFLPVILFNYFESKNQCFMSITIRYGQRMIFIAFLNFIQIFMLEIKISGQT